MNRIPTIFLLLLVLVLGFANLGNRGCGPVDTAVGDSCCGPATFTAAELVGTWDVEVTSMTAACMNDPNYTRDVSGYFSTLNATATLTPCGDGVNYCYNLSKTIHNAACTGSYVNTVEVGKYYMSGNGMILYNTTNASSMMTVVNRASANEFFMQYMSPGADTIRAVKR